MNIFNKIFLQFAMLASPLYKKMGIDTYRLTSILVMKLIMDDRRTSALNLNKRTSRGPVSAATLTTMFISLITGLLFMVTFVIGDNALMQFTFFFSFFMFMLAGLLIADFTGVLIDVRDNQIILPKPVDERTFLVARLLHIFIHICKIVLPLSLPSIIIVSFKYGLLQMLVMLPMILLATLFCIFIINATYLVVLKITTPSRFQSIINYFQIVFAIVLYGGYQFVPRMIRHVDMDSFKPEQKWELVALPSYWFAAAIQLIPSLSGTTQMIVASAMALLLPFVGLLLVVKYLAPAFTRKLSLITSVDLGVQSASAKVKFSIGALWMNLWARLLTTNKTERAAFVFTSKITARSRDFRIRVYPSIGYMIVFIALMFFQDRHLNMEAIREQNTEGRILVLSTMYFACFLLVVAINQLMYSEKFKASWIWFTTPVDKPGYVIAGAAKSAIAKFYFPIAVAICVAGLFAIGPSFLLNFALGVLNVLLVAYVLVRVGMRQLPFSKQESNSSRSGKWMIQLAIMIIPFSMAFLHYIIYNMPLALIFVMILVIIAIWLLASGVKQINWSQIRDSYED